MKKIMIAASMLLSGVVIAQQAPTPNPANDPTTGLPAVQKGQYAWFRGGNSTANPAGTNNIFGTMWDSPIWTYTANKNRMVVNANKVVPDLNGFLNVSTAGYVGIGPNSIHPTLHPNGLWNDFGPFSLLHLHGETTPGEGVFPGGYRPWMRTGITFSDQVDLGYMGIRSLLPGITPSTNISELVINWSNDPNVGQYGPDDMAFRFTAGNASTASTISTNLATNNDLDGLHIARFTGTGEFGLGNTFGAGPPGGLYVRPASLMHMSRDSYKETWLQITNQYGTKQTVNDGLRFGINKGTNPSGFIRWQENTPFIIQTESDNSPGGITQNERMRITSIGALLAVSGYMGLTSPVNTTRVAISHRGNQPITRPMSLLHLGYNTGLVGSGTTDGWRKWMDIGTFTNNGTDNMYVGLKQEKGSFPLNDRQDAVINWGDNGGSNPFNGPDNLRFIFTETTTGVGNSPANQANGLEVARFSPQLASTLATPNYGMMGIGDFSPNSPNDVNGLPVDAKLDIDGDLRIRQVTNDNTLTQILAIDPTDLNRVHWVDAPNIGGVGNYCSDPQVPLTSNYEIALSNANYYFSKQGNSINSVGIGLPCGTPINFARLQVLQASNNPLFNPGFNIAGQFNNTAGGILSVGTYSDATGNGNTNIGGYFGATNGSSINIGIYASAQGAGNYAGYFNGNVHVNGLLTISDQQFKTNINTIGNATAIINQLLPRDFFFDTTAYQQIHFNGNKQYGFIAQEVEPILPELVTNSIFPALYDSLGNQTSAAVNFKSLNYNAFIAILMKGMQEQQADLDNKDSLINNLEDRLAALEQCINDAHLCDDDDDNGDDNDRIGNTQTIQLENLNAIILDQNLPNPFAEKTSINYTIPDDVVEAQLLFYDMNGRIIKQVNITERGEGKLTVYGENLQNGIYTYSLIADGKLIATKKMVKQ